MRQLALPLPPAPASFRAEDLMEDASNAAAIAFLREPDRWPQHRLALWGLDGVGKTHMLQVTAQRGGWPVWDGARLRGLAELPAAPGIALDDADLVPDEAALFHLLNASAEAGKYLLLAGRDAPARWPVALPDLASRLRGMAAVRVQSPTDELLAALLARHFLLRQLRVEAPLQAWLLARLPREAGAMAAAAARLDRAALAAGGAVTRRLARQVLADLPGFKPLDDDDSEADASATSTLPVGLG